MDNEFKRVTPGWDEKQNAGNDNGSIYDILMLVENHIQDCATTLAGEGIDIGYISQIPAIEEVVEWKGSIYAYATALREYVYDKIDQPLYKAFVNGATETISRIKLENYSVADDLDICGNNEALIAKHQGYEFYRKKELKFADFLGTENQNGTLIRSESLEAFTAVFGSQYEKMMESAGYAEGEGSALEEYLENLEKSGEFDHKMDKPFESFISCILDVTIIKPLIEACTGIEWFTGEDLSNTERAMKAAFAVADAITLGTGIVATKAGEIGAKEALKLTAKTMLGDAIANTASYVVTQTGDSLGLEKGWFK